MRAIGLLIALAGFGAAPTMATAAPPAAPAPTTLQGVDLPAFIHVEKWDEYLRLSGAGIEYRRFLPFQVVALYVDRGEIDPRSLGDGLKRCRIILHWLPPSAEDETAMRDYWLAQLNEAVEDPQMRARLASRLQAAAQALGTGKRGDVVYVDYDPERGLQILRGETSQGQFTGLELARAILGLWFGPKADRELRGELLGAKVPTP